STSADGSVSTTGAGAIGADELGAPSTQPATASASATSIPTRRTIDPPPFIRTAFGPKPNARVRTASRTSPSVVNSSADGGRVSHALVGAFSLSFNGS